jgi:hypothetical protein
LNIFKSRVYQRYILDYVSEQVEKIERPEKKILSRRGVMLIYVVVKRNLEYGSSASVLLGS